MLLRTINSKQLELSNNTITYSYYESGLLWPEMVYLICIIKNTQQQAEASIQYMSASILQIFKAGTH